MIKNIDKFGIYEGTSFKVNNFERFIQVNNWMWPRTETGLPKTDKETFKEMAEIHPEIGPLKELKALIGGLNFKSIIGGSDGRSRTLISPFWTKTGRNAPKDDEEKKNRGELRVGLCLGFLLV